MEIIRIEIIANRAMCGKIWLDFIEANPGCKACGSQCQPTNESLHSQTLPEAHQRSGDRRRSGSEANGALDPARPASAAAPSSSRAHERIPGRSAEPRPSPVALRPPQPEHDLRPRSTICTGGCDESSPSSGLPGFQVSHQGRARSPAEPRPGMEGAGPPPLR